MEREKKKYIIFLVLLAVYGYFVYGVYAPYRANRFLCDVPFALMKNSLLGEHLRSGILMMLATVCVVKLVQSGKTKQKAVLFTPFLVAFYILFYCTMKVLIGIVDPFSVFFSYMRDTAIELLLSAAVVSLFCRFCMFRTIRVLPEESTTHD